MHNTDPLAQLKDIHLPNAISWWPLALGWDLLIGAGIVLLSVAGYLLYRKRKHAVAKKHALQLLKEYRQVYEKDGNAQQASVCISELLKRVALVYFPRAQVASMHGKDWIAFLNQSSKGIDFGAVETLLLDAPFRETLALDVQPLFVCAQLWIKQRGVPCLN